MPAVNTTIYASLKSAVSEAQGTSATPTINAGNFVDFGRASTGSGVDEVARAAIEAHAGNTEIHVTAEDKAAWNGKAEISDIPSTLPADGGNADTVDNKHASDFMQFLGDFRHGSILETVLTLNGSGYIYFGSANCTDMPVDGQYYFAEVRKVSTNYEIMATQFGSGTVFTNRYNGSSQTWSGWKNVADGGNAASVGVYTEAKLAELESRIAALEAK